MADTMICPKPTRKIDGLTPEKLSLIDFSNGTGQDIRVTVSNEEQIAIKNEAGARSVVFHTGGWVPICQHVNGIYIFNIQSVKGRSLHDVAFDGPDMTVTKNSSSTDPHKRTLHIYIQHMGETGPHAEWSALVAIDHHKVWPSV